MIREHIFSARTPTEPHFRWRGGDVSRIESLSDAAFAFALTWLLIADSQIKNSGRLLEVIQGIPPLACCFAILIWMWGTHYRYFRRYGLEDNLTVFYNALLLFAVMVYVYPLRFLLEFVYYDVILRRGAQPGKEFMVKQQDSLLMMQIYGAGYIVIFLIFALMVRHAYKQRDLLKLDEIEVYLTRRSIRGHLLTAGVGLLSILVTVCIPASVLHPGATAGIAGMIYGLNGFVHWFHGASTAKGLEPLEAKLAAESEKVTS